MRVLIATRAPRRFGTWQSFLQREGLDVVTAAPGCGERQQVSPETAPDVVLLDLTEEGSQVGECRRWLGQLHPDVAIGLIAAAPRQRLPAITGADVDDVVDVAAAAEEVLCRVQRVARRRPRQALVIELGELTIYPAEAKVLVAGQPVPLRRREFELLRFLASHPDRVFRREALVREVWGAGYQGSPRTVDMHIRRLRGRLGASGGRHLQTVRGVGYRIAAPAAFGSGGASTSRSAEPPERSS